MVYGLIIQVYKENHKLESKNNAIQMKKVIQKKLLNPELISKLKQKKMIKLDIKT